jgi:5-formyltetrahydrofolate cyclo-ligase
MNKADTRSLVWTTLREEGAARFPFPVKGRIPNFAGAKDAAARLIEHPIFEGVTAIKCNPDSPQKYLREAALRRGITVYIPTPRLKGGFMRLDPAAIAPEDYADASMLSRMEPHVQEVPLDEFPQVDLIVTGCVAVTRTGKRCGKGEGYSDLEAAILNELGLEPVPIVTTVHDLQVVDDFPTDEHDIELTVIATPTELFETGIEPKKSVLRWDTLSDEDLDDMPLLRQLQRR